MTADIGVIGLGVMGGNLALNLAEKGSRVAVFDGDPGKAEALTAQAGPLAARISPCASLTALMAALAPPRAVVLLVPAGEAVDDLTAALAPLADSGDLLIDCGNANFRDTRRRAAAWSEGAPAFLGIGLSGGEEGARHGPSIMAGGDPEAWAAVAPRFEAIAARHQGVPCCAWLGPDGAGHFVKTLHNGIEYADMQMIAEVYGILRDGLGLDPEEVAETFARWNAGPLRSFLIEVTAKVAAAVDPGTGKPVLEVIKDSAGQKGTGRWAAIEGQELGAPATAIEAAVAARALSSRRDARQAAEARSGPAATPLDGALGDRPGSLARLEGALLAGRILAYAQGFDVLREASTVWGWDLPLPTIARLWRAGCIIRADLLDDIAAALETQPKGGHLILAPAMAAHLSARHADLRTVVATAVAHGLPVPALSAALAHFDGARTGRSTANLIQAQRDFFGAHGFERLDREGFFHGPW